jgi:hypothetical protein
VCPGWSYPGRSLEDVSYWVYENWRAHGQRATVHRGDCGHCNDGAGQRGGTRSDNGKWHGPFMTVNDALRQAALCGGEQRHCASCTPED